MASRSILRDRCRTAPRRPGMRARLPRGGRAPASGARRNNSSRSIRPGSARVRCLGNGGMDGERRGRGFVSRAGARIRGVAVGHQAAHRRLRRLARRERPARPLHPGAGRAPVRAHRNRPAHGRGRGRVLAREVRADQRVFRPRVRTPPAARVPGAQHDVPDRAAMGPRGAAVDPPPQDRDARHRHRARGPQAAGRGLAVAAARPERREAGGGRVRPGQSHAPRAARRGAALRPRAHERRQGVVHRRRGDGRDPVLATRGRQLPAPAARAGPRHPRHAGPERARLRARAHAQSAAERARPDLRAVDRHRREPERPRRVARLHRAVRGPAERLLRRAQQDRHAVGRDQDAGGDRAPREPPGGPGERRAARPREPGAAGVGAEGAGREHYRRRCAARAQRHRRARGGAALRADPRAPPDHPGDGARRDADTDRGHARQRALAPGGRDRPARRAGVGARREAQRERGAAPSRPRARSSSSSAGSRTCRRCAPCSRTVRTRSSPAQPRRASTPRPGAR